MFRVTIPMRASDVMCDLLFWLFLVFDVFGVCYWLGSQFAAVLISANWLRPERALVFALSMAVLLTPGVLKGLVSVVKRKA